MTGITFRLRSRIGALKLTLLGCIGGMYLFSRPRFYSSKRRDKRFVFSSLGGGVVTLIFLCQPERITLADGVARTLVGWSARCFGMRCGTRCGLWRAVGRPVRTVDFLIFFPFTVLPSVPMQDTGDCVWQLLLLWRGLCTRYLFCCLLTVALGFKRRNDKKNKTA